MNIHSQGSYPAKALSNFAPHQFIFDGVQCFSIESLLQSLKTANIDHQVKICSMSAREAKKTGSSINWQDLQILYWQGVAYPRDSFQYQQLLDRIYQTVFDSCPDFKQALIDTGTEPLEHTIGRTDVHETILTAEEFCSRLLNLRDSVGILQF